MACYYKINNSGDTLPPYKGFHLQKVKSAKVCGPIINYDFSRHVLIELLDDVTPESELWSELGLIENKNVVHKRIMIDSHRIKCRRAIVICINSDEAKQLAQRISQTRVMNRCVCAVVIHDLLSDLCLFEKQIIQFGDYRPQHQLLYVSDLSRSRGPSGLVQFLKEKFSPFGTILSVLVCSDDDDYAFPEGVIKFSYLSEAFAAELAFDQYVVGKERLSVTAHHNILLSQCDLRVRLRNAQWCYSAENVSSESLFHSHIDNYKLNNLNSVENDLVEKSLSNLHISHLNNTISTENNLKHNLESTLPVFSQSNFSINTSRKRIDKTFSYVKKENDKEAQNLSKFILSQHINSLNLHNCKTGLVENHDPPEISDSFGQEMEINTSDTLPFEMATTKIINKVNGSENYEPFSRKDMNIDSLLNINKSHKNVPDSDSFVTCDNLDSNTNTLFISPKKSSCKSFYSQDNNSILEYQSVSSNFKEVPSSQKENLNEIGVNRKSSKLSKKRKKKFTPSQKLCLKSQRTDVSQNSIQNRNSISQISASESSQQGKSEKCNELALRRNLDLSVTADQQKSSDFSETSKVTDWLSKLPTKSIQNVEPSCALQIENTVDEKNKFHSRISVHRAPSLKPNAIVSPDLKILCFDNSSDKNEDINKMSMVSSSYNNSICLTNIYKSPLQAWLKHELMSSTKNNVVKSEKTSKSVIVCATKTKDVIISVGCSHMTCDSCYPESTDLLLGYS